MKAFAGIAVFVATLLSPARIHAGESLSEREVVREALDESYAQGRGGEMGGNEGARAAGERVGRPNGRCGFSAHGHDSVQHLYRLGVDGFAERYRSPARTSAEAEARAAFKEVRRVRLDVMANAYALLGLNRKSQGLLVQFVEVSKAKCEVGGRSQADVLAAQTDESKLEQERVRLEQELSAQQSALNVLMNHPAKTLLSTPVSLAFKPLRWKPSRRWW